MNFIQPNTEVWQQQIPPFTGNQQAFMNLYLTAMYEHIERCGRVCYKSEDKLGEKDPKIFVDRMIKSGHLSVLEHGTVYLTIPCNEWVDKEEFFESYGANPYTQFNDDDCDWFNGNGNVYITTNYRVLVENNWLGDLEYVTVPCDKHEKRTTVCFTTDIGVSREANRHRKNSISEESTRYCNYSKEKFGSGINYAVPSDTTEEEIASALKDLVLSFMSGESLDPTAGVKTDDWNAIHWWLWGLRCCEVSYLKQIELGRVPQQARRSLPLNTKTTLVHTAFESDWQHFLDLRSRGTTGAPHPDMKLVADQLLKQMEQ